MNRKIKKIRNTLVKRFKTNDPFELADNLNIHVMSWPFHESVNGLYQYERREKLIYINSTLSINEQRVLCAQLLGHAILRPKSNYIFLKNHIEFSISDYETEASIFAVEILVSDDKINNYRTYSLEQVSFIEKVPLELIKLKFHQSDLSIFYNQCCKLFVLMYFSYNILC